MSERTARRTRGELTLFAAGKDEPRRRRIADVWLLILAALISVAAGLIASGNVDREEKITAAFSALLGWLQPLWTIIYNGATVAVLTVLVLALVRGRYALARDVVVAAALTMLVGVVLAEMTTGRSIDFGQVFWGWGAPQYPELRLAAVTAVALVTTPDLTQPFRRLTRCLIVAVALASLVLGGTYPSYLLGGLALGMAAGAITRLVFGSAAGFPTIGRVRSGLAELDVVVDDLTLTDGSPAGAVQYVGSRAQVRTVVTVYGRDARDSQLLTRFWRGLWYTDSGPRASVTRRELVEHEALMLYAAAAAGVLAPTVRTAGMVGTGDTLLVTEELPWRPLSESATDEFSDELLAKVWGVAAKMRESRLGHSALNIEAFRVIAAAGSSDIDSSRVAVVGWTRGQLSVGDDDLAIDTAELLVSCSMLVGEERALAAAEHEIGRHALAAALPYIQRAALTPALREAVSDADFELKSLRTTMAERFDETLPEIAELHRVSWRDIAMLAMIVIAAYFLIGQLVDVGIDTIIDELQGAEWSWVIFAFLVLQLTLVCQAYASIAAVGQPLPFGPTTLLQSAIKFVGLTVPSAAGRVAVTTRFLVKQGVPTPIALTQGAIDSLAGFAVQLVILLTILPSLDLNLDLDDVDVGPMIKAGIILLGVAAVAIIVAAIVPALRKRVQPFFSAAITNVKAMGSSPKRLLQVFSGNCADQLCYAIAMGAAVQAVGADTSIAEMLVVNTLASLLSGLVPVPGGIGTSEFVIASGMIAVGVPPAQAYAATIIFRLLSFYIPPIPGYVSLRWLSKHGFV